MVAYESQAWSASARSSFRQWMERRSFVRNVKNLVSNLGIDLKTHVLDWPEFRDLQLAFIRSGVINWEIPTDHAITTLLFHSAKDTE